jgi:hypothetical protein
VISLSIRMKDPPRPAAEKTAKKRRKTAKKVQKTPPHRFFAQRFR